MTSDEPQAEQSPAEPVGETTVSTSPRPGPRPGPPRPVPRPPAASHAPTVPASDPRRFGRVADDGTVYLVCTSAGEVGINISADHLVCDLATFDSMAQRFGRVNRFGDGDARVDVLYPATY
ncbi:MAG: hypothetical protein WCP30_02805, partial [Mycobacteriaceae bacterium]